MISPQFAHDDDAPRRPRRDVGRGFPPSLVGQVQGGLNLYLLLKTPALMPALGGALNVLKKKKIFPALEKLEYVHFARFVPAPDSSALWVITTFDGELEPYIMDFVGEVGDVFTELLQFIQDAPRLPVQKYPQDFLNFIKIHNVTLGGDVWSAYPEHTVLDIHRLIGSS
jgi:hypothetical protein